MYVIPRKAEGVTEWTEAALLDTLDDGNKLQVAWYEGNPADIDLVKE